MGLAMTQGYRTTGPRSSIPGYHARVSSHDWSRYRELVGGAPSEYVSLGTVGHASTTPQYVRLQDGKVLVEVTLVPSGDEVVATLACGGGWYMGLQYGARVVIGLPGGSGGIPLILGLVTDGSQPWTPPTGAYLTPTSTPPLMGVLRTPTGQMLVLETGAGGDLVIRSGASVLVQVDSGEQVLVRGRVHLGSSASPSSPATPASVAPGGQVTSGQEWGQYTPAPATNATLPPPAPGTPADGVVRVKDPSQSNIVVDPDFWAWVIGVTAAAGYPGAVPTTLTTLPAAGSRNTCSDD